MKGVPHGVVTSALVVVALLAAGSAAFPAGVALPTGPMEIAQSAGSLSVEIFDMFNVPYRGWWDFRGVYGDLPIGADCFSFENIPGGAGSPNPSGTGACDTGAPGYDGETWVQYPHINAIKWFHSGPGTALPAPDIQIYAPYRMRMIGTDQPGATLAQPVYLPVFNPAEPAGTTLRLKWDFNYLTKAETEAIDLACGSSAAFGYDGFVSRNILTVTMDLQESKRIFGDVTTPVFSPTAIPGTQQWTTPSNGFSSNNFYATSVTNGQVSEYGSYGVPQPAVASPIAKVEVGLEGKTAEDDDVRVEFSTDGGVTWTAAGTVNLGTLDSTTFFDVTSLRTWTFALLNNVNFRTRIVYVQMGATASMNSVDWVPVRVKSDVPEFAQSWWDQNSDPRCLAKRTIEAKWENFVAALGGSGTVMGPYDILNSYEYWYQPFMTNLYDQSIDPVTGETTVVIDHVTFGAEVLFPRLFYWGSTPYLDPGPDGRTGTPDDIVNAELYPHNRQGWWKWELAWIEDLHFDTVIGPTDQDFTLQTVMDYHFTAFANPGPDGILHSNGLDLMPGTADDVASTDDIAEWQWMPVLTDYVYGDPAVGWSPLHTASELDPYSGPDKKAFTSDDLRYSYARPGMVYYGTQFPYDIVPAEWDLGAGDTVVVRLPNGLSPNGGAVTFVDPYSALTSAPDGSNLIMKSSKIGFFQSTPALPAGSSASDSDGDGILDTVSLVGPIDWGAPALPRWGFPSLEFTPAAPPIQVSIAAPWTQLYETQTMDVTFEASVAGSPLSGASVSAGVSAGGSLAPTSCTTDASGRCKVTASANAGSLGSRVTVTATASKALFSDGTGGFAFDVVAASTMAITQISSNRNEMMSFETATITLRLESGGVGVEAGLLTPSTRFGGPFGAVTQLGGGSYAFGWTAPARTTQGFARIDVRAKVGGYLDATGFVTILVDPNKTNEFEPTQLFLLTSSPASVIAGGSGKVTVFAFTIEGFVVSGGTVTASLRGVGTLTVVMDELNGVYTFTYVAPASVASPTNVLITISAIKFGYAIATTRVGITVLPAG